MSLPNDPKATWPPEAWKLIYSDYAESAAWYGGDMDKLSMIYADKIYSPYSEHSFDTSRNAGEEVRNMIHVPACSDIANKSAAMLFGEHPKIRIAAAHEENPTSEATQAQTWLDSMIEATDAHSRITNAADSCSGLGGVYLKCDWDRDLSEYPIINVAQADTAIPEFKFGFLRAVTFWRVIEGDGKKIFRLLERHEPGLVLSELYAGDTDVLGSPIGLTASNETAGIVPRVETGIEGLTCVYIPNVEPNRKRRGLNIGRADTATLESLMNSLDYVYTALLRDIRVGMGRIMAPADYFETDGKGNWAFNESREVYIKLEAMPGQNGIGNDISVSQFDIRTIELLAAADGYLRRIYAGASYSPQSFGMDIDGQAESGVALNIRERTSVQTTAKKGDYWASRLKYIINVAMDIARIHLSAKLGDCKADVELQDSVESDITTVATSVELLNRAQALSVRTKIRMVHPDWSLQEVDEEASKIEEETGASVPDVTMLGNGSFNNNQTQDNNQQDDKNKQAGE